MAADPATGRPVSSGLSELLRTMPKAELHLHLDGSLRPGTALELARTRRIPDAPRTLAEMRRALVAPEHGADQATLLRAFDLPISMLQDADALERVTSELVEDKVGDGVHYVEIRWAPLLHLTKGLSTAGGIAAVCRGARRTAERTGAVVRLIATAMRSHDPDANVTLAETAATFRDDGLAGFDLAGPEAAFPDASAHAEAFERARQGGLGITVHAGEWGGAGQVRRALAIRPDRIAHGSGAIADPDLQDELRERGIPLDLCPTSNVQAGIVPSVEAHPLARLHRAGVPVTLSTDDLTVSAITLTEEYGQAIERIGLTLPELWAIDRAALAHAFVDEPTRGRLTHAFDDWAVGRPDLGSQPPRAASSGR